MVNNFFMVFSGTPPKNRLIVLGGVLKTLLIESSLIDKIKFQFLLKNN